MCRAQAYVYCCPKQNSHENDQLKSFLTIYSSSERQQKFVEDCADKLNQKQILCHKSLSRAEYFHRKVEKSVQVFFFCCWNEFVEFLSTVKFVWKKNSTTGQEDFQKLDNAFTTTDRIFTNLSSNDAKIKILWSCIDSSVRSIEIYPLYRIYVFISQEKWNEYRWVRKIWRTN